jgi:hypothetical protein
MKTSRGFPLFLLSLLICLATPSPATAQYIYLDLNGDGLNTPADLLSGTLPVNVAVYLRTDRNRDGTQPTCATGAQSLSIGSFEFILRAVGGTVSWGTLSGGLFAGGMPTRSAQDASDFYAGRFDSTDVYVLAGQIHLGTVLVTPLTGTPLLSFATSTPLSATYLTSFGSQCRGPDGDYTMALGRDWFDADGTFGTLLANVSGTVFQDSNGTSSGNCALDAGEVGMPGWIVTLFPGGQRVLTSKDGSYKLMNVPPGIYTVQVSVPSSWNQTCPSPGVGQPVTVLAGQTYSSLNFGVKPANLPPLLNPIANRSIAYGQITNQPLTAADPDGTPLSFSLLNGPSFASVTTTGPAAGNLRLAPQSTDAGFHAVTVAASDGVFDSRRSATFRILSPTGVATQDAPGRLAAAIVPNPLNPAGALRFRTFQPGFLRIALYDANGRRVRTLVDKPMAPAGYHEIPIDARDEAGGPLPSGVYFFNIETREGSQSGRAVVLK